MTPINSTPSSSDDKISTSKIIDESHPRSTSTSRSSSSNNPNKSSSRSKSTQNSNLTSSSKTPANTDSTMLDPLVFAAATGGLTYPYFLPSLLSQPTETANNNPTSTYPFSTLSSSLMNPAATLYPFLSPDWFTSSNGFGSLTSDKSISNFMFKFFFLINYLFFRSLRF